MQKVLCTEQAVLGDSGSGPKVDMPLGGEERRRTIEAIVWRTDQGKKSR